MPSIKESNDYGRELEELLRLQTSPIAVKMLLSEADIPPDAIRPVKDHGNHYAQCQAFGLSRRDRQTIAMVKEDHWCPAPLLAYGLVPLPDNPDAKSMNPYPTFEYGRYIGVLSAPLRTAAFEPDVVVIYADTNQLRNMLLSLKNEEWPQVKSNFFPFSCTFAVSSPIIEGHYWINLPDPGEYVRALTQVGEMIFSIPRVKLAGFMADLKTYFKESRYADEQMMMRPDFIQPDLYKQVFGAWGMDHTE